jgi:hypothetical protein
MSLTNTAPLAAAEVARDAAEALYTSLTAKRDPGAAAQLGVLQTAQTTYEGEVLARTPYPVGDTPTVFP